MFIEATGEKFGDLRIDNVTLTDTDEHQLLIGPAILGQFKSINTLGGIGECLSKQPAKNSAICASTTLLLLIPMNINFSLVLQFWDSSKALIPWVGLANVYRSNRRKIRRFAHRQRYSY